MARILYVMNSHEYATRHRMPLLHAARDRGHDVAAAVPLDSPAHRLLHRNGITVYPVRLSRKGAGPVGELMAVASLVYLYRKLRPDLVHHSTIKPVLYGSLAARISGVFCVVNAVTGLGYVYSSRSIRARLIRQVANVLYRHALAHPNQRLIFQNRDDWQDLERYGVIRSADALLIPSSGVDIDLYVPGPASIQGAPVVTLVGRMLRSKGVVEFIEVARQIRASGRDVRFWLVGGEDPGNPEGIPRRQLEDWMREGVVEWVGEVDDMVSVYRNSAIVCLPSHREGLPKVLIEAAACGRPVVTVDTPGCRDAAVHEVTGLIAPPGDVDALASHLLRLLGDPELRREMGAAGRRYVIDNFSVASVVGQTMAVYEDLLPAGPIGEGRAVGTTVDRPK